MNDFLYNLINYEPQNKDKTLEYFLEISSNEIFFDDVFLFRLFNWKIKECSSNEKKDAILIAIVLYEIIWRILKKGCEPKDETGKFQPIINKYKDNYINKQLAMEITLFQLQNPEYGEDWFGIWFYQTDLTKKLYLDTLSSAME